MYGSLSLRQLSPLIALLIAGLVLPMFANQYLLYIGNVLMMYAVLAIGLDILLGWAGQFAFAHTAFFGLGCYATALLNVKFGVPFAIGMPLAALLAGVVGVLVAIPATRMRDIYLALATFAFAEGMYWVFNTWEPVTGGSTGLRIIPSNVLGFRVSTDFSAFPVSASILALMIAATMYLSRSRFGREMAAVRESEHVATSSGVNVRRTKVVAFGISAIYAGVAGGMFTLAQSFVSPDQFGFNTTILVLTMIVVGGMGRLPGVLVGVVILGLLPEVLRTTMRSFQIWQELVYGLILMLSIMFMPQGIWGSLVKLFTRAPAAKLPEEKRHNV
ncbi:MAG: branched-chain amino acid ABC transporter permease [Pseudomonadota bacterium]